MDKIFRTVKSKNALVDVLHNLVDDSSINTIVTYRQHKASSSTPNPEDQTIGDTLYTNFANLGVLKTYFTEFEKFMSGGDVEIGDVRFIVLKNDVSNSPGTEDRVVETKNQSGVTYAVVKWDVDPLDIAYVLHCRRP